jgi:hypothetical protein
MYPTDVKHEYTSFINKKVAAEEDGVWTTGKVQCLYQDILQSMTHMLPTNIILTNKSQPFSIVWADNTDSIRNQHKLDTTRPPTTGGNFRTTSNGVAAPSSLPSSSSIPQDPLLPRHDLEAAPPAARVFAGTHSRPGDLVDILTRSGSFAFLRDLFDTECLFELRDCRITRVMTTGEVIHQFAAGMHLVLDLTDKYPPVSFTERQQVPVR